MTVPGVVDWSYHEARRHLVRGGRRRLVNHVATPTLDDAGNRVVRCECGWLGNGLGWASHLDGVVRSALDADPEKRTRSPGQRSGPR